MNIAHIGVEQHFDRNLINRIVTLVFADDIFGILQRVPRIKWPKHCANARVPHSLRWESCTPGPRRFFAIQLNPPQAVRHREIT